MNSLRSLHVFIFLGLCVAMPSGLALGQGVVAAKALLGEWEGFLTDGDGSNPAQRRMKHHAHDHRPEDQRLGWAGPADGRGD